MKVAQHRTQAMPQRGIVLQPRVVPSAGQPWVNEMKNRLTLKGLRPER